MRGRHQSRRRYAFDLHRAGRRRRGDRSPAADVPQRQGAVAGTGVELIAWRDNEMKVFFLLAAIVALISVSANAGELKTIESPRGASIRVWIQQTSKTADTLVLL